MRIDYRWAKGQADLFRQGAKELVQLAPDVLVASTSLAVPALQEATRTLPIVFINVVDPVGAGFAASLAAPGGNATGFALFEFGISAKWVELLKQIAPSVTRIAILRDASLAGVGQLGAIQAVGSLFGVELTTIGIGDLSQMELALTKFARSPNVGLIVTLSQLAAAHRVLIIGLAAKLGLPAIYALPLFAKSGGLIAYGPDAVDPYRRAAEYIDRILKGENPADLAGACTDQIRTGDQPQDREGDGPRSPALVARPRRRGDRIVGGPAPTLLHCIRPLVARSGPTEMSATGPLSKAKRTSASDCRTIAIYEYTP